MEETIYSDLEKDKKTKKQSNTKVASFQKVTKLTVEGTDIWVPNPDYVEWLERKVSRLEGNMIDLSEKMRFMEETLRNVDLRGAHYGPISR